MKSMKDNYGNSSKKKKAGYRKISIRKEEARIDTLLQNQQILLDASGLSPLEGLLIRRADQKRPVRNDFLG